MLGRLVLPSARRPITSSSGILFHHHRRSVAFLTSAPAQSIITMPYSTADSVTSKTERYPQKRHHQHQKPKSSTPRRKALPRLKLRALLRDTPRDHRGQSSCVDRRQTQSGVTGRTHITPLHPCGRVLSKKLAGRRSPGSV